MKPIAIIGAPSLSLSMAASLVRTSQIVVSEIPTVKDYIDLQEFRRIERDVWKQLRNEPWIIPSKNRTFSRKRKRHMRRQNLRKHGIIAIRISKTSL